MVNAMEAPRRIVNWMRAGDERFCSVYACMSARAHRLHGALIHWHARSPGPAAERCPSLAEHLWNRALRGGVKNTKGRSKYYVHCGMYYDGRRMAPKKLDYPHYFNCLGQR